MRFSQNKNRTRNSFLMRLLAYILTSFIIPFVIKVVKRKLEEKQRLSCYKCHGKLDVIHKGEYYCKNCKIIRKDHN
jgi:late competence protein required for DNA uptake (superfamily II DNA/RNA helicase)